jgi:hypothetical protein
MPIETLLVKKWLISSGGDSRTIYLQKKTGKSSEAIMIRIESFDEIAIKYKLLNIEA